MGPDISIQERKVKRARRLLSQAEEVDRRRLDSERERRLQRSDIGSRPPVLPRHLARRLVEAKDTETEQERFDRWRDEDARLLMQDSLDEMYRTYYSQPPSGSLSEQLRNIREGRGAYRGRMRGRGGFFGDVLSSIF